MRLTTISSLTGSIGGGLQTRLIRTSDTVLHVFTSFADNKIVHYYSINNGKTFLSENLSIYSNTFSLTKDSNDTLHLVYLGLDGKLYYSKGTKNGYTFSWSVASIVDTSPSGIYSSSLTILLDNYSNIHIFLGSNSFDWYRSPSGLSWTKTRLISLLNNSKISGSAIVDPDNNLLVVFLAHFDTTGAGYAKRVYSVKISYPSWTVGTVNLIESSPLNIGDPSMCGALDLEVTPDGKIVYIYFSQEGVMPVPTHIYFRKSSNPYDILNWGTVKDLSSYTCGTRSQPVLSILSSQHFRIYQEATNGKIYCRESLDSGVVWTETELIDVGSPASIGISIGQGDWGYLDLMVLGSLLYLYLGRNPYAQFGLVYEEDETGDAPLVEIFPDTIKYSDRFDDWTISNCLRYEDLIEFKATGAQATLDYDWNVSDWTWIHTRVKFDQEGIGGSLKLEINIGGSWYELETYTTSGRFSHVCTPYGDGIRLTRSGNSSIQVDYCILSEKEKRTLSETISGLNVKLQTLNKGVNSSEITVFNENFQYSTDNPMDFEVSDYMLVWMGKLGTGIRNKMFAGRISKVDYTGAGYGTQKIIIDGQGFSAELIKPPVILYKRYANINAETILDEYLAGLLQVKKSQFPDEWFNGVIVTNFTKKFTGQNPLGVFQEILENSYDSDDERGMEATEIPPGVLLGHEKDSTEWKVKTTLYPNKYAIEDDLTPLYNAIDIFGDSSKMYPSDGDSWTEGSLVGWEGLYGSVLSLVTTPIPKAGIKSVKVLVAPQPIDWYGWNHPDGWCHYVVLFGPGSLEVTFQFSCPSGQAILFNRAGCYQEQEGHAEIYWKFGESGSYTRLTIPENEIADEYEELYTKVDPNGYETGSVNTDLFVKWKLTGMGLFQQGCFNNFTIYYRYSPAGIQEKFSSRFTLPIAEYPDGLDLELPDSPTKLEFVLGSVIQEPSSGEGSKPTISIKLVCKDGSSKTYRGEFSGIGAGDWATFSIDIGPDANNKGWSATPVGKVESIEFEFTITTDFFHATDYLLIDWLHFGSAKFFGTWEDTTSIAKYGKRWSEPVEDTTLLSDNQCELKAKTLVLMNKDPVLTFSPIEIDGSVIFVPSFLINVQVPNENFNQWLSILEIEHKLEGTEWLTSLTIGAEPVTIDYVIRSLRGK
jgi:hypothetical protein